MSRFKLTLYTFLLVIFGMTQTSCQDDFGFSELGIGDGMATVSLDASFSPFAEGALTRSLSPVQGDVLKDLKDLAILVYDANPDADGNHVLKEELSVWNVDVSGVTDTNRDGADASSGTSAETQTKTLSNIILEKIPFGRYYIVGVANLKTGTENYLKNHPEDCKTLDGLLRMRMSWDEQYISRNGEMLGYFTLESDKVVPSADTSFQPVTINAAGIKLHSWLRRCASKITIDFDGSDLRENVYIYIKEARIYDVAKDCTLGSGQPLNLSTAEGDLDFNNHVSDPVNGLLSPYTSESEVLANKNYQVISYGSGEATNWPLITKGTPRISELTSNTGVFTKDEKGYIDFHTESAPALYFYENMQGENETPGKLPVANVQSTEQKPSGGLAYNSKDNVECGTFIEVIAYYHSDAVGNAGTGVAKYRFMLGKDVIKNYDAERNYHYKLTLKFHGNANDYDWHIEYKDRPGFNVPNPWYVSYLYNHDSILPFKFTPDDNWILVKLDAEIEENPWYPTALADSQLTNPSVTLRPTAPYGDDENPYYNKINQHPCNGFLSLRVSTATVVTDQMAGSTWSSYDDANAYKINELYYLGQTKDNSLDQSRRSIMDNGVVITQPNDYPDDFEQKDKDRETITYQQKGDSYSFNIPLFTRSKVLVKQTGYSGNNYFVGHERVARICLKAHQVNKTTGLTKTEVGYVNVVQVRRIVNPKGVYRKSGNNEPFNVKLMWLNGDNADSFTPLVSHGPWKADIIGDANFITLDGKQDVYGSTNSPVEFTIRFNRTNTDPNDKTVRSACVRVRYHNLTCTHLIFVRQGYEPVALSTVDESKSKKPAKWSLYNMISKAIATSDPRDEGSLFKYGNADDPIDAINNVYWTKAEDSENKIFIYKNLTGKQFDSESNDPAFQQLKSNVTMPFENGLLIANNSTDDNSKKFKQWSEINHNSNGGFTDGYIAKAAKMSDFEDLYLSSNIEFGYGVLYADGATETQVLVENAYGYFRGEGNAHKGMRGMFAYHWDGKESGGSSLNARSVFFPIGRSGYGHRKDYKEGMNGDKDGGGILRYSCSRGAPNVNLFSNAAPVFVSIYRREGGIYWARQKESKYYEWNGSQVDDSNAPAFGLDINYFSYDVNAITKVNISDGADACFVRCVAD